MLQSKFSTALRAKFRRKFEFINVFCQTNGRLKCPIFQFDVHINSSEFSIQIFHFFKTNYPGWFEGKIVLLLSSCFFFSFFVSLSVYLFFFPSTVGIWSFMRGVEGGTQSQRWRDGQSERRQEGYIQQKGNSTFLIYSLFFLIKSSYIGSSFPSHAPLPIC